MVKRAVLIGSQTGGLAGVHRDIEVMAHVLSPLGFSCIPLTEGKATYQGIVNTYRELIQASASDDAAVVYYSGHGGRFRNPRADADPSMPTWLHFLVPTDIDDRSDSRFRGILAEELSLLQLQLTDKTVNVTTIIDCCHAARMSRDAGLLPKANNQLMGFPWSNVYDRWSSIIAEARSSGADSNPDAVRLVACASDQTAYEVPDPDLGGSHGLLTSRLVPILAASSSAKLTWHGALNILRPAVMDIVPQQRPEVEGGQANRYLFSVDSSSETGVLPIRVLSGVPVVENAALFGLAVGDSYLIVPAGTDPSQPIGTAVIDALIEGRARLHLDGVAPEDLPPGVAAHPLEVALGARPVAILPLENVDRDRVASALRASPSLRVVEESRGVLASIALGDGTMRLLDAFGEPIQFERPITTGTLTSIAEDLQTLARATHLRELESGSESTALPEDVHISYARLLPEGGEAPLEPSGEHLFCGDRLVIHVRNDSSEVRFVSVLDIGLAGAVSLQTTSEPGGVTLAAGEHYDVGRNSQWVVQGLELFWPPEMPKTAPRPETMITIVSDDRVSRLDGLVQEGVKVRSQINVARSALERLIDDIDVGRRDSRPISVLDRPSRYRVQRFDFVLHPQTRSTEADEPSFEIDERPDPSFRLIVPRSAGAPTQVALRLKEAIIHSNRSILKAAVRIDAMVVTVPPPGAGDPYRVATARFDRIKDGDRLPFDDLLLYDGPVGRFMDLAVWAAKDNHPDLDLAEMLSQEIRNTDFKSAIALLAGLAVAAPEAAVVAGAAAAVATLIRTGARLIDALEGMSIGVYRTSLLPHQRFGVSDDGVGRHPAEGLLRAQDMSFAYEVVDLDASM